MKVWVVTEFDDDDEYSRIVGVFNTYDIAVYAAQIEEEFFQGLYNYEIEPFEIMDKPDKERLEWHKR